MPNDDKRQKELTQEELDAQKFRTFFSTSVAQVPEAMTRRDNEEAEKAPKKGLFGGLFRRKENTAELPAEPEAEPAAPDALPPTGEIRLDGSVEEPDAGLELARHADEELLPFEDDELDTPIAPATPAPAEPAKPAAPSTPAKPAAPQPAEDPEKKPENRASRPAEPRPRTAMEQKEDEEMKELKAMLFGKPKPAPKAAPVPAAAPAEPAKKEEPAPLTGLVFAEEKMPLPETKPNPAPAEPAKTEPPKGETPAEPVPPQPEMKTKQATETPAFRFFGKADDEVSAPTRDAAPGPDDSMSLPLFGEEDDGQPPVTAPVRPAQPAAAEQAEPQPEAAQPTAENTPAETAEEAPATPESVGEKLRRMGAALTLRCVLSGVLALVLLHFGLVAEGVLAPIGVLDPVVAPAAFYAANLLFLAGALAVAYPVLRDGLQGLKDRPSADTMPALAACGALLEAIIALLNAQSYQQSSFTILSGIAALGLFMALLGSRVQLAAVKGGYDLAMSEPEHRGAYRVKDKDLVRLLSRSLDQKDPWVLLSRPADWDETLVEQCFGERASERRARKTALILLGVAVVAGLVFLLFGGGLSGGAAALTAVLCMGSPLSSTLVAGLASLRLQRSAAAVGAVVPGWAAIEELGGVDTVQVDADDLFTADSVTLEDIRIFKGGRIDRAILYAASILNQSCETLRGLFSQIVEDRTDILYPVKDLELHRGLGFAAWCDNNRVLIGNRMYMEREGVPLPEQEYEDQHSQNGALQILYLAVSGSLHAMFVLRYVGGRNAARGLEALQKENIRLLVSCEDPSLTARHITEAYHLPEGMVTLLDQEQCDALEAAKAAPASEEKGQETCCMIHLKGFLSLTGGLRAAEQAQNAEQTATTVQLVSVWFSVVIAVLLTYAGSIGTLPLAAVLMYQAAWSGLSLAVCALKQHNG